MSAVATFRAVPYVIRQETPRNDPAFAKSRALIEAIRKQSLKDLETLATIKDLPLLWCWEVNPHIHFFEFREPTPLMLASLTPPLDPSEEGKCALLQKLFSMGSNPYEETNFDPLQKRCDPHNWRYTFTLLLPHLSRKVAEVWLRSAIKDQGSRSPLASLVHCERPELPSPIQIVFEADRPDLFALLIDYGASLSISSFPYSHPFRLAEQAVKQNRVKMLDWIIRESPQVLTQSDPETRTLAHFAAAAENSALLAYLYRCRPDLEKAKTTRPIDIEPGNNTLPAGLTPSQYGSWMAHFTALRALVSLIEIAIYLPWDENLGPSNFQSALSKIISTKPLHACLQRIGESSRLAPILVPLIQARLRALSEVAQEKPPVLA